jgi:hypothetical protein
MNKVYQILIGLIAIACYISAGFYFIGTNGFRELSYLNTLFISGFFAISFVALAMVQSKTDTSQSITLVVGNYLKGILLVVLSVAVLYAITLVSTSKFSTLLISNLIYFSLAILGLYGVYQLIKGTKGFNAANNNPYLQLLTHGMFIIPCTIVETIMRVGKDIITTPRYIYTILALEILFLVGYIGLPKLWRAISGIEHDVLVDGTAIPLYREKTVGVVDDNYHQGYAFTFFADNVPESSIEGDTNVPIFQVGSDTITVYYDPITQLMTMEILEPNGKTLINIGEAPLQKWNRIVVNREASRLDVFVNGYLQYTGSYDLNVLYKDDIRVGKDDNGLRGGIRDVYLSRDKPFGHTFIRVY